MRLPLRLCQCLLLRHRCQRSDALIAKDHSEDEISKIIGADSLGFLQNSRIYDIVKDCNIKHFCTACFDGNYPAEKPRGLR